MNEHKSDEFYIGYLPQTPSGVRRRLHMIVTGLLVLSVLTAVVLVLGQQRLRTGIFEFGDVRTFEGLMLARPIPTLLVARPGITGKLPVHSRYVLVAPGKHGADELVGVFHYRQVKLKGTLVYRDGITMIEVVPDSIEAIPSNETRAQLPSIVARERRLHGEQVLTGEIVDSKCYLGVMSPGEAKPHRDCAVRCISGGVPPMFVVHHQNGERTLLWLMDRDGASVGKAVLDLVAEPVEITGEVRQEGDELFLRSDPKTYRRAP
jgi:hypothetical protein